MADENMVANAEPRDGDEQKNGNNLELKEDIENDSSEEFANLNAQLDQLNSILDTLEMKNDVIHAEFVELLKSNRETRQQFQESVKNGTIDTLSSNKSDSQ